MISGTGTGGAGGVAGGFTGVEAAPTVSGEREHGTGAEAGAVAADGGHVPETLTRSQALGCWLAALPLTAAIVALVVHGRASEGSTVELTAVAVAGVALFGVLTCIDTLTLLLPTRLVTASGALAAGASLWALAQGALSWSTIGIAAACSLAAWLVCTTVWLLAPVGGFGWGDCRLALVCGYLLGLEGPMEALLGLAVLGAFSSVILAPLLILVRSRLPAVRSRGSEAAGIPFGPMLMAGTVITLAYPAGVTSLLAG